VVLVSVATLAVTIVAGILLARVARLDRPTASLGMVAGGASGIVAMAGDLGADDRLVAFMQYLRVLIITLLTPLLVPLTAGVSLLDGYLATTPGGLYAVLPIAYGSGADTTFVLAVQGLRLLGMVLAAPVVVRLLMASGTRRVAR
jgi:uncharacterized membrane protein AbrB (regulator of aidB expression)